MSSCFVNLQTIIHVLDKVVLKQFTVNHYPGNYLNIRNTNVQHKVTFYLH